MGKQRPNSMVTESSTEQRPRSGGFFPAIRKRLTMSSDALNQAQGGTEDRQPASKSGSGSGSTQVPSATAPRAIPSKKAEETARKKRQRRLKKLELAAERQERKNKALVTPAGQRIFQLPSKVRPISLFLRMGAMASERDLVPLECYDGNSDDETVGGSYPPHPAALQTRTIFHLADVDDEAGGEGMVDDDSCEEPPRSPAPDGRCLRRASEARLKRPFSIQLPLLSALKKPDQTGTQGKRPRSLRFLDPKDQKLYLAVSHSDFLSKIADEQTNTELRQSVEEIKIQDGIDEAAYNSHLSTEDSSIESGGGSPKDYTTSRPKRHPPRRSRPPPAEAGFIADTERSGNMSDWNTAETVQQTADAHHLSTIQELRLSSKSMPIVPYRDPASGDSSDVSGFEADSEERHIMRRGSTDRIARQ